MLCNECELKGRCYPQQVEEVKKTDDCLDFIEREYDRTPDEWTYSDEVTELLRG